MHRGARGPRCPGRPGRSEGGQPAGVPAGRGRAAPGPVPADPDAAPVRPGWCPVSATVRLEAETAEVEHAGGSVTFRVLVDGRWVGWVGDGRERRGHRYGVRRWWACWREDGDTAARWSTGLDYRSRKAALAALVAELAGGDR